MAAAKKIVITLKRSLIGVPEKQRKVVRSLGLRKREQSVVQEDNAVIRGMVFKVNHLLRVERSGK
jgi:large subunit ribosomal protein L30